MIKFKGFFTLLAFIWLWVCGCAALHQCFSSGKIAWFGLLVNAWALPIWMLMRYRNPQKYSGDQRETPAFALVLAGLAIALLTDTGRGAALYLSIVNLFVLLVYLFHLSALRHPSAPAVDSVFPVLKTAAGETWRAQDRSATVDAQGLLLVFLRGSYCASSRALLSQLSGLESVLEHTGVQVELFATEADNNWWRQWCCLARAEYVAIDAREKESAFVAAGGVPLWFYLPRLPSLIFGGNWSGEGAAAACRPSCWLLDRDGYVVWRHLPDNYRVPGSAEFLQGQLFRLEE